MFCPKCGKQNPDDGKFCRGCGTDLGNVSSALTGALPKSHQLIDRKGRRVSWESAIGRLFGGVAFFAVAIALAFSNTGRGWWFWLLIPAFFSLGAGVAQWIQISKAEQGMTAGVMHENSPASLPNVSNTALPPQQTEFVPVPESRYKTGDLVPPSVTEDTTRHLNSDPEGETMTLPKV